MLIFILVVVVILAGVVIVLRSTTPPESNARRSGLWCLLCGLAAAVSTAMIGQATFGWISGFDPPGWLRIATFWLLPISVIAAAILGTLSLKRNSGRRLGMTGLALAIFAAAAFFAIVASVNY